MTTAERLKAITAKLGDAARLQGVVRQGESQLAWAAFAGSAWSAACAILERVRPELELPVLTDVHEDTPLDEVAAVVDVLQTPALLCRQTDFIVAVASQASP